MLLAFSVWQHGLSDDGELQEYPQDVAYLWRANTGLVNYLFPKNIS